jgi:hypothetical protein
LSVYNNLASKIIYISNVVPDLNFSRVRSDYVILMRLELYFTCARNFIVKSLFPYANELQTNGIPDPILLSLPCPFYFPFGPDQEHRFEYHV